MKILHILDHSIPLHSGYTFRTRNILEQQRALGWETAQVTSSKHLNPAGAEEQVDGFHFYRTNSNQGIVARLPVANQLAVINSLAARLDQVIALEQPDLLHAHSPSLNGLAALRAGHRHRLPVVYECRAFWEDAAVDHGTSREQGLRYRLTRMLETRVFRQAHAVTTICEGLRQDIRARGVESDKVTVIPNAVNIEKFSIHSNKDPSLLADLQLTGKTLVGFIGSFYAYEGLPLLLEAMPAICSHTPNVVLLLVGGGPQEKLIKARTQALGLGGRVIFTGRVPHDQVHRYYDLVDIFVYPRLSMRLTELVTPLKPLEAMAQGRLVVASDVGGHKEMIQDRVTGYLFPANDAVALAQTVSTLLRDRDRWPALCRAGREYVERERNWAASVARYKQVYERLLVRS